jgi:CHAT domain-containing protein
VDRYRSENFTQASISKLKDSLKVESWQALAMGVSEPHGGLPSLPAVRKELHSLVRSTDSASAGLLPGRLLLDQSFTEEEMVRALQLHYPVIHIASHFSFRPGSEADSFLLLGGKGQGNEGELLSLAQIRTNPNIRFRDAELLTLSACNTATSGSARGREVDGLGDIVQLKGAKAVLASLWEVDDESTGLLMRRFYEFWTQHPGTPKAEALRQAQRALLHGELKASGGQSTDNSYASPHFWAPFVLFGNWR